MSITHESWTMNQNTFPRSVPRQHRKLCSPNKHKIGRDIPPDQKEGRACGTLEKTCHPCAPRGPEAMTKMRKRRGFFQGNPVWTKWDMSTGCNLPLGQLIMTHGTDTGQWYNPSYNRICIYYTLSLRRKQKLIPKMNNQYKTIRGGRKDGSAVKCMCCSCRRLQFKS